jgi:hypothetical protein
VRVARDSLLVELERLYRERYVRFVNVARGITGDSVRAADAVHEGFANAIRARKGFRGEGPLEAWVWRAVVNLHFPHATPNFQHAVDGGPATKVGSDRTGCGHAHPKQVRAHPVFSVGLLASVAALTACGASDEPNGVFAVKDALLLHQRARLPGPDPDAPVAQTLKPPETPSLCECGGGGGI